MTEIQNALYVFAGIVIVLHISLVVFLFVDSLKRKKKKEYQDMSASEKQKICKHDGVKFYASYCGCAYGNPVCSKCNKELEDC